MPCFFSASLCGPLLRARGFSVWPVCCRVSPVAGSLASVLYDLELGGERAQQLVAWLKHSEKRWDFIIYPSRIPAQVIILTAPTVTQDTITTLYALSVLWVNFLLSRYFTLYWHYTFIGLGIHVQYYFYSFLRYQNKNLEIVKTPWRSFFSSEH